MIRSHRKTLLDLLTLPTAPFHEQHVADYIRRWAADRPALRLSEDEFGNLQLGLRRGRAGGRPLVLAAHMDHPGFEARKMVGRSRLQAVWRGGVPPEYFRGTGVRFWSRGRWVRGKIRSITTWIDAGRRRVRTATIAVPQAVDGGAIGMWDLPDPQVRGGRVYARGCDDVAGVAAILSALDEVLGGRRPANVIALLTRAEEVGFAGALAGARAGVLPNGARVISIECSSERAGGRMGHGPILRVGDLSSIFTPDLSAFCRSIATDLAKRDRAFRFQRKLMDGGTCEATAFASDGYEATGLCVALGNYHNVDSQRRRIGPEYIDLQDWEGLVRLLAALATALEYKGDPALRKRLDRLHRKYTPLLRKIKLKVEN